MSTQKHHPHHTHGSEYPTPPSHGATPEHSATNPEHSATHSTTPEHTATHPTPPEHAASHPAPPEHSATHSTTSEHTATHPTPPEHAASSPEITLEKEFELERMILFTDAVFAIAITLLIIDIKWPELHAEQKGAQLFNFFAPTIFGFVAFATSFVYIGRSWSVHLRLFRLIKKYDQGLINRNLFFLFFIVMFPFANSGLTQHNAYAYVIPVFIYLANLGFLGIAHYRLCRYIILEKPSLSVEGREAEKKFVYARGRSMMFITCATPIIGVGLWLLFPEHPFYILYSFVFLFLGLRVVKRRLRALYPKDTDNEA